MKSETIFLQKLFFLEKSSCFVNILLFEKEICSCFWELVWYFFIQVKIYVKTKMISKGTVVRCFLQLEMTPVVYLANHAVYGSSNEIKCFYVNSIVQWLLIQYYCSWNIVSVNFSIRYKEYVNFGQIFFYFEFRQSIANVNYVSVKSRNLFW